MASTYVFDAYGTLFDVHSAVARHADALGAESGRLSSLWRAKQLEYAWVCSLLGGYRDFAALTEEALDYALAIVAPAHVGLKPRLLAAYRTLDAYPEVAGVLGELKARGKTIAILSNGTPAMLADAVRSAKLTDLVDTVISVEEVRTYKTDPRVYDLLTRRYGFAAGEISFQSSNRWDVAGAVAFGLKAVWINRGAQPDEYRDLAPAAEVRSLTGLL